MPFGFRQDVRIFGRAFREATTARRRKVVWTLFFAVPILATFNAICLALDRVLFVGFTRTPVRDPIFISGHSRSGTTLMHELLTADDQFNWFMAYELLLPSLLQKKRLHPAAARAEWSGEDASRQESDVLAQGPEPDRDLPRRAIRRDGPESLRDDPEHPEDHAPQLQGLGHRSGADRIGEGDAPGLRRSRFADHGLFRDRAETRREPCPRVQAVHDHSPSEIGLAPQPIREALAPLFDRFHWPEPTATPSREIPR